MNPILYEYGKTAHEVQEWLMPHCQYPFVVGSVRRKKPEPHDIELVVVEPHNTFYQFTDELVGAYVPQLWDVLQATPEQVSRCEPDLEVSRWGTLLRRLKVDGKIVELYVANDNNAGYITWLRTGPADANKWIMQNRQRIWGDTWRAEGGHIYDRNGDVMPIYAEDQFFERVLGIPSILPQNRTLSMYYKLFKERL